MHRIINAILAMLLCSSLGAQHKPVPKAKFSCLLSNYTMTVVHRHQDGTATEEEVDDWHARCKVTLDEKLIYDRELNYAHPATLSDASAEVEQFRKQLPQIIKEKQ